MGDIAKAVRSLIIPAPNREPLIPKPPQGAKPAVVGRGRTPAAGAGGGGDEIEASHAARTYWAPVTITSSDGLFVLELDPVRKITFQSGVTLELADPSA
jgi:hypothetical protein